MRAVAIDARDGAALAAALAGCRVLVNAASYRVNLVAMEAALAAGCDYLDLGGLYWMTARQLELHDRFARAGRLAVLGIGSSPGKTNVMAARGVRELGGEAVASIHVAAAGRDPEPTSLLRTPYALRTLLDELTMAPVVLDDGVPRELEPLSPGGVVRFPEPIGEVATIHTLHSELQTFGSSFGVQPGELPAVAGARAARAPRGAARRRRGGGRGGAGRGRGAVGARRVGTRRRARRRGRARGAGERADVADGRVGARRRDRLDGRPRGGARAAARARANSPRRRPPARALRRSRRHVPRA